MITTSAMTITIIKHNVQVGDAQGELRKVDLKTGNVFGKFKHISGTRRSLLLGFTGVVWQVSFGL